MKNEGKGEKGGEWGSKGKENRGKSMFSQSSGLML